MVDAVGRICGHLHSRNLHLNYTACMERLKSANVSSICRPTVPLDRKSSNDPSGTPMPLHLEQKSLCFPHMDIYASMRCIDIVIYTAFVHIKEL
jgi:hypothetical protein